MINNHASSPSMPYNPFDTVSLLKWGILAFGLIWTVFNLHESMLENVAHDALPYMDSYVSKFVSEGRWVNFALFDTLRLVPAVVAGTLCNVFIFIFGYQVAMGVRKDRWLACCFALLMINVPYFTMLFKWPMTLIPGTLMLALFSCIKDRYSRPVILLTSGILLFATYPAFYFLMPLLFIRQLNEENFRSLLQFLCLWIVGYVLGYAVANLSVYSYTLLQNGTGHFIEFVSWRKSTPSTDISGIIANIAKSAGNFERNARYLAALSPLFYIPAAITLIWALKHHLKYTLVALLVVFSIYASVIPLGVKVPLRSGVTLPLGMAMLILLVPHFWWRALLWVTLFVPFAWQMHQYNYGYNEKRILFAEMVTEHDVHNYLQQPQQFRKIIVSVDETKTSAYFYKLTGSDVFKNLSNLRLHYIRPYLYQYGWHDKDIIVKDVPRAQVRGEATIEKQGDQLLVSID
ncbi:hypothetical protein [Vibrio gazogenes]|uniref:Glucosyl transferase GtrII n=1 Tax=Vibrio gazogenes DSM 21264 = NBRC 103151 TaxID=1123492 RepID=A0A1M5ANL7_VIBGA|nr:hypothetical protein [Vibrio gazogenes]USP12655.1 GtrA family protein [Vibrio gazogenes]SHF31850.1 hypothetical protein SAMN02745781_01967 [Vibrio gazogenes DSM 21264] [Vibrio gazogenes DSM 21264 = NBRC 103151]SJN57758.1 hypothetical protein BQ6471_02708 [Vibrio gazogenes]